MAGSPNNRAQINIGAADVTSQMFINIFNAANYSYSSGATPAALDGDFYPVRNFSGLISGNAYFVNTTLSTTGPWTLTWPAGRANFKIIFSKAGTTSSAINCTIANGSGSGNLTVTGNGSAGSVVINWNDTTGVIWSFDGTYTSWASNTTGIMGLVRSSDLTAFNAGTYFTPEYLAVMSGLNPRTIRPLGLNMARNGSQDTNESKWAYRRSPTALSFVSEAFPPGARAGGAASFGTIAYTAATGLYTSAITADMSAGAWVHGDVVVGTNNLQSSPITVSGTANNAGKVRLTVNSTTGLVVSNVVRIVAVGGTTEANGLQTIFSIDSGTTFTINTSFVNAYAASSGFVGYQRLAITGKTGTKLILSRSCVPIGYANATDEQNILAGNATYVYDSIQDAVLYTSGGISLAWAPLEAQCQLANTLNCNLWYNSPTWATDDYVTQSANLIYTYLNSPLKLYYEFSNELWNSFQPALFTCLYRGAALGIGNNLDYHALRIRQINGTLLPASSWSAAMSRLRRTYCFQAAANLNDTFVTTYMNGNNLGSYGYNVSPNRPIDVSTTLCYAPYMGGTGLSGQSPDVAVVPTIYDAPLLQSIANNWTGVSGGTQAAAIALIDDAIRQGRNRVQNVTASGTTFTTPLAHNLSVEHFIRFNVTGGTTYSGLNTQQLYKVASTPTSTTFTCIAVTANATTGAAVNAGSVGSGTTTVGWCGDYFGSGAAQELCLFNIVNTFMTGREALAASYDSSRAAASMSNLEIEWYEGALEASAPSTAQCFAIGVTLAGDATGATASAAITAAVLAWRNDPLSSLTIQEYYKTFMGTAPGWISYGAMPHSVATSNLILMGAGLYSLCDNFSYVSPSKYKLYDGFAAFSAAAPQGAFRYIQ